MKELITNLIKMLTEFLGKFEQVETDTTEPDGTTMATRNELVLLQASKEIGTKEILGDKNNAQVLKYHAYSRVDNDLSKAQPDSVPWCASFVCYCLEMVGMGSTNSMGARSYLGWGVSTKSAPLPGDVVVYWRGSKQGWSGHVGFFIKLEGEWIYTLGGNQSDAVNVSKYHLDYLLDIRRSSKAGEYSPEEKSKLNQLASQVVAGEVLAGSKVV